MAKRAAFLANNHSFHTTNAVSRRIRAAAVVGSRPAVHRTPHVVVWGARPVVNITSRRVVQVRASAGDRGRFRHGNPRLVVGAGWTGHRVVVAGAHVPVGHYYVLGADVALPVPGLAHRPWHQL